MCSYRCRQKTENLNRQGRTAKASGTQLSMKTLCILVIAVPLGLFLTGQTGWGAKTYVTDSFRISLRRGPSIENKILRFIPSGQPLEVLESQDGWSRVHLLEEEKGVMEGWVLSRYLVTRLPWEDQAESLSQENARLKEEIAHIDEKWEKKVGRENGLAKKLKQDYERALKTAQRLTVENESFRASKRNKWFATGALVLFAGLIVGLTLGRKPRRRRLSY